jgi:tRNA(fMet)-specific endonuclease VapC
MARARGYLLDTDTCIYALKDRHGVLDRMLQKPRGAIHVSAITVAELRAGAAKSTTAKKTTRLLESFLLPLTLVPFEPDDATAYARVRAALEKAGTPIGPLDTLIAGHAVARGFTLVSHNQREFSRVTGLVLEDWATG